MCLGGEWVGVVGTLGGVAIGGIVTHLVEGARFNRERGTQLADVRREKLEELYQAIEYQRSAVSSAMVLSMSIATGMPRPEEIKKYDTSKLTMLTVIYLPAALPAFEETMKALREHDLSKLALVSEPRSIEALKAAHETQNEFQQKAQELQRVIAEAARELIQ